MSDKWVVASKRNDKVNPATARFCSAHFLADDFERDLYAELTNKPVKKRLKKSAVPSMHLSKEAPVPVNMEPEEPEEPEERTIEVSTRTRYTHCIDEILLYCLIHCFVIVQPTGTQ